MPSHITAGFVLPDDVHPDAFRRALEEFVRSQGVTVFDYSPVREFSEALEEMGLPRPLNTTLTRLLIFGPDDLAEFTEEALDDKPGIGPGVIRQINLALARVGRALSGNEVIPPDDMIERLDLSPDNYWLLRTRYRRLSELTARDFADIMRLEVETGLSHSLLIRALAYLGLGLEPLRGTRLISELEPVLTALEIDILPILAAAGVRRNEPINSLSATRIRTGLAAAYGADAHIRDIELSVDRVRTVLGRYGFTLSD